jgi:MerR family redox-sensitive transcriptional activator SoxR
MTIGYVARQAGVRASAIRYYETAGLLPRPTRIAGRRCYDQSMLERLAVIEFAKECGFTLQEIRRIFQASGSAGPISARWQASVRDKLAELDAQTKRIAAMRALLERAAKCRCLDVEECGRRVIAGRRGVRQPSGA